VTPFGRAFEEILAVLDRFEIPFFVGGSVASGRHGLARQTNDIDIVADINPAIVADLVRELSRSFYADGQEIESAIESGRSFNIHLKSIAKFDIFPVGRSSFTRSELSRRIYTQAPVPGLEIIEFPVASAKDTILSKLVWFRKGPEISERQWEDILGVLSAQSGRLDLAYMKKWAAEVGVGDLLVKALAARNQ